MPATIDAICGAETSKSSVLALIPGMVAGDSEKSFATQLLKIHGLTRRKHEVQATCSVQEQLENGIVAACCFNLEVECLKEPFFLNGISKNDIWKIRFPIQKKRRFASCRI